MFKAEKIIDEQNEKHDTSVKDSERRTWKWSYSIVTFWIHDMHVPNQK